MDPSKRHFVTMSYSLTTITLPKEMTHAHESLSRFEARARLPLQQLTDDPQMRNLLVNVWPKLNASTTLNPNMDKAAHDKYITDLRVASLIDRKLVEFLNKEAAEIFRHLEINKSNLIKRLEYLKAKEEETRRMQDEAFLREKELLLASLNLALSNIDLDVAKILEDCLSQINFLQGKVEHVHQQKRTVHHKLGQEVAKLFNQDEYKINGKSIFEIDPSLPPEARKEKEIQLGEHFNREVIPLHKELKEVEKKYANKVKERQEAEIARDAEIKRQRDNDIDKMTDDEVYKELYQDDAKLEGNEDEILENLAQEEKDLNEAEKEADRAEKKIDKKIELQGKAKESAKQALSMAKDIALKQEQEKRMSMLEERKQAVMTNIDSVDRKRHSIVKKRLELQKRRDKLAAQINSFEQKAKKNDIHVKILEKKPYNKFYWTPRATLAERRRKQLEKLETKVTRLKSEESHLLQLKDQLSEKFMHTIGKIRSLFSYRKAAAMTDAEVANKIKSALDQHPEVGKKESEEIKELDKIEDDYRGQIQQQRENAIEAKNKADSFKQYFATEKEALTGEHTPSNSHVEQLFSDIQSHSVKKSEKREIKTNNMGT